MKTINKIIAIAFVLMMAIAPVLIATESTQAAMVDPDIKVNNFDDMGGGSIEVTVTGANPQKDVEIIVKNEDGSKTWASSTVTADDAGKAVAKLSWNFGSSGDKIVFIWFKIQKEDGNWESEVINDGGVPISVGHSIWKDPLTYVAIVVVIILIVIAIYIKMRGMPGKKKDKKEKTFTQIEEERKAGEKKSFFSKEEKPAEIKDDTTSTEKQEYTPGKGFFRKKQ